jgi:GH15 family glucan-1,4-alpha-glucosidase
MYGIGGERELGERELGEADLGWLPGYEGSGPGRVGNGAAHQLQLDVYGEVTEALHLAHTAGLARNDYATGLQLKLIEYLERHWPEPDEGTCEVRGPRRHFVYSKVMSWVAVDRTIRLAESGEADGPLGRWRDLRDEIHRDVCEKGYDPERNTFTQSYGSKELDAALLLIPQVGFGVTSHMSESRTDGPGLSASGGRRPGRHRPRKAPGRGRRDGRLAVVGIRTPPPPRGDHREVLSLGAGTRTP